MIEQTTLSENDVVRTLCKKSFYFFLKEFWNEIIKEEPLWNWHIKYLCDEVQVVVERIVDNKPKEYDLIINVPPGETKSTIVSVVLPVWVWLRMRHFKTIVSTHTTIPLGLNLSRLSRDIIRSEKFRLLFPGFELRDDQDTKGYFVNMDGGWRLVATVAGHSPLGLHGHLLVVDDPIDPKSVRGVTDTKINEANEWLIQDLSGRKVDKTVTATILLMQRLHQNDPTGNRLSRVVEGEGGSVKHICLPADLEDGYTVIPDYLSNFYVDGLLDPDRLSRAVLKEYKMLGEYTYAAQYGQSPVPLGGGMFKCDRLIIDDPPPLSEFKVIARFWDKAASLGRGDFTAGVKIGIHKNGIVWVLHVERGQWDVEERERIIQNTAEIDGRNVRIGQEREGGSGGKESAKATVKNLQGFMVETVIASSRGSKIAWAEPFATQVNNQNARLARGDWNQAYVDELKFFPYGAHDDQVDGSSGSYILCANNQSTLEDWIDVAF